MFSLLTNGGPFMLVILLVSIIALALFVERAAFLYFRMKLNMDNAYKKILHPLEKSNYRGAIEECSKIHKHPMGSILKAGLLKADSKDKDIVRAMEEKLLSEVPRVKARVNMLTLFANISTLLGLLGTIMGLITAFKGVTSASDAMKQEILAKGISMAMLTTAAGLVVAIPCLVGYYILNNRSDYLIDKMEEKALGMANLLSSLKHQEQV
ncbi:MAG: MotA/TolQ/ExbB proton channel family protein [Deltaproteobacteria bacterium]|nr:MotA/TolQ/ExbB proton channel family protein [Deltaproteobacteria bacterium]